MFFTEFKNLTFEQIKELCVKKNLNFRYNEDLYLVKYNRYNNKCNLNDEFVQKFRGTVFDRKTNECVCYTFKKGVNYSNFKNNHKIEDIIVEESIDGTMINVYYHNDK